MATLNSIKAQIAKLTKQAQTMEGKAVQKVLALMDKLGVSIDELPRGRGRGRKSGSAAAKQSAGVAKYRDPATGKTWTGHGRAPEWIKNAANRDDFLVEKSGGAAPAKAAKRAVKAGPKSSRRPVKKVVKSRKRATAGKSGEAS